MAIIDNYGRIDLSKDIKDEFVEKLDHTLRFQYIGASKKKIRKYGREKLSNGTSFRKELSDFLNGKIRNNTIQQPRINEEFKKIGVHDISDPNFNALWLTSYAYEFFMIIMVQKEMDETKGILEKELIGIDNLTDSFSDLRKGFSLLNAQLALAISSKDFGNVIHFKKLSDASENEYQSILQTEKFPTILWTKKYPENLIQNTNFVILFADMAKKIIIDNNYDFSKNTHKLSVRENPLLKFMVKDFMPEVINKISGYLRVSESGFGYNVYKMISDIQKNTKFRGNEPIYNSDGAQQKARLMKYYSDNAVLWENWYSKVFNEGQIYLEWRRNVKSNNSEFYNTFDYVITADELLNDIFTDYRNNKI
ncbi:hypothetical protein [Lactobacillus terrae]|uniref:hypothetical protein n=1 Tax=Lactobacillus terrae TaxID=2269374 RepID=UPI000C1B6AA8|nr:hypothetical protein [Lactobacillus terrae]